MDLTLGLLLPPLMAGLVLATLVGTAAARFGFPLPDEHRRQGSIDGLRGYLALLVMVHHFGIWAIMPETGRWADAPLVLLGNFGAGCVCLFFMITGCLFFPKALAGRATDWRALYVSRGFRILPLQSVVVLVVSLVALSRVDLSGDLKLAQYPLRAAMWLTSWREPALFGYERSALVNAQVLWSLKVEWEFYLVGLPLIAIGCASAGRKVAQWLVPILLVVGGTLLHLVATGLWGLVAIYAVFGCGMLAQGVRGTNVAPFLRGKIVALVATILLAAAMLWAPHPDDPLPLACYACFLLCVACGNRFFGLFATRGALVLGEASFGIYMLHGIVLDLVFTPLWAADRGAGRERAGLAAARLDAGDGGGRDRPVPAGRAARDPAGAPGGGADGATGISRRQFGRGRRALTLSRARRRRGASCLPSIPGRRRPRWRRR